jgi:hypothetical protein
LIPTGAVRSASRSATAPWGSHERGRPQTSWRSTRGPTGCAAKIQVGLGPRGESRSATAPSWVAGAGSVAVIRVDPASGKTRTIPMPGLCQDVASAVGTVWAIMPQGEQFAVRVDAATGPGVGKADHDRFRTGQRRLRGRLGVGRERRRDRDSDRRRERRGGSEARGRLLARGLDRDEVATCGSSARMESSGAYTWGECFFAAPTGLGLPGQRLEEGNLSSRLKALLVLTVFALLLTAVAGCGADATTTTRAPPTPARRADPDQHDALERGRRKPMLTISGGSKRGRAQVQQEHAQRQVRATVKITDGQTPRPWRTRWASRGNGVTSGRQSPSPRAACRP